MWRYLMIRLEETVTATLHRSYKINSFERHNIMNLRSYIFVTLSSQCNITSTDSAIGVLATYKHNTLLKTLEVCLLNKKVNFNCMLNLICGVNKKYESENFFHILIYIVY